MAGYSSRRDQLWYFAVQLTEEETKSIQFAQQEEKHGQRIQSKYNQLVSNLSCLGDIIAIMYQEDKLSLKEFEHIHSLHSTPIRANEELLSIIARKPRDVYECFLALIKKTNQLHLYQMLVSGDDACDNANGQDASDHKDLISRNFMWLSENLDTETGLTTLLFQQNVLTVREKERIFCVNDTFLKNELLLGLLSKKSPKDFDTFLEALEELGQGHLIKILRKPEDSTAGRATEQSARQTPKSICNELLPKVLLESGQKLYILPSSKPKTLPKPGQKLTPSRSFSKPVLPPKPDTQSSTIQHDAKSIHVVAKNTEKTVQYRRTDRIKVRLKKLESQLQTETAIKVASVCLFHLDKQEDSLKICLHILLQECHRMRRETVSRNVEANVELEQLRENVSQYSAVASLNEVFRTQLHSMQQELNSERFQSNKDRIHLEDKINKLKTDIHDEKAKCKRLDEEKHLSNTVIMKLNERFKKAECDKKFFQQQLQELNTRLATCEVTFEESNSEVAFLRNERDKLKETCEILSKENEVRNELEMQLHHAQENNRNLLGQLKENDKSLEVAEEETFDHIKTQKVTLSEISMANDPLSKLREELEIEKHERAELEAKFSLATAQLEQLDRKTDGLSITSVTQESHVIRNNHQFLVENIKSGPLVDLLHEKNCITDEERDHLNNQFNNFYRNDALLHWMRMITFKQGKGLKVLECFRQSDQNFVVDLLSKGGVLVKSKMSTKLAKERQSLGLFAKTSSENVKALKEKEAMVIETLNQRQGVPLSNNENATSDIADDEIIITPFCHQEDNGIVVWFWCQSKNAQRNLQSIYLYSSDILLGKLVTIFKTLSNGSVSSDSELLVPTGITIYMADFTKNEKIVDFEADPKLLLKIKRNTAEKTYEGIRAFAVLADEIFAIIKKNSEVEVYNRTTLQFQRRFTVDNLTEPRDIVSCSRNNCLYIIDGKPLGQPMEILRVDIINGNILKKVWQGNDWGRLSVTNESNLILAVLDKSKLLEITPDGQLVRETMLTIPNPRHAVKLTSDRFVVAYERCPGGGICITNNKGKLLMSSSHKVLDSADFFPVNVAVNKDGSLLVADVDGGRILLLTSTLKYQRELLFIPKKHGLRHPRMLFVDESNGRLLVCEDRLNGGRILVFDMAG